MALLYFDKNVEKVCHFYFYLWVQIIIIVFFTNWWDTYNDVIATIIWKNNWPFCSKIFQYLKYFFFQFLTSKRRKIVDRKFSIIFWKNVYNSAIPPILYVYLQDFLGIPSLALLVIVLLIIISRHFQLIKKTPAKIVPLSLWGKN